MSRNASGTYSLPGGVNPVVNGTTITVSWANSTLNDLATEMTDSLDRSGKGGMLAQFKAFDGTSSAPGVSWANELDSGIYRVGSKDFKFQVNANTIQEWTATGAVFTGQAAGTAVAATGGASSGIAVSGTGGAGAGTGGYFVGGGTGAALIVHTGNAFFTGTAPTKTTTSTALTAANIVRAWGTITTDGAGNATLEDGFNVTSVSISGDAVLVTIGQNFANDDFAIIPSALSAQGAAAVICGANTVAVGTFELGLTTAASGVIRDLSTSAATLSFIAIGRQ